MKNNLFSVCAAPCLLLALSAAGISQNVPVQKTGSRTPGRTSARKPPAGEGAENKSTTDATPLSDEDQIKAIVDLPPAERIEKLKAFIDSHPNSPLKARAGELIVSAHAANGDEKLRIGDNAAGVDEFRAAIAAAPANMSDKLFYDVVGQIPSNLFLRGQRDAGLEAAHSIEALINQDPIRLLTIGTFYLRVEATDEAAQIAQTVLKLKPDSASAFQMLGVAAQMSFRLDDAIAQFSHALEIDPKSAVARSNLADLKRATGNPEEALALYREQLLLTPDSKGVQSGIILSLFDLGRKEEAEAELKSALESDSNNLPLLVSAAYWMAAHGNGDRAVELAQSAVSIQPRYTWSYIALARALALVGKPQNSDGLITYAHRFGSFPTLDYELASALSTSGLYQEASEALVRSFSLRGDTIRTRLGNRVPADATNFIDLLAPERKASIFQPAAADSRANAKSMKALLEFTQALSADGLKAGTPQESTAVEAAQRFVGDKDAMRVYRELFVSERLLRHQIGYDAVIEFMADAPNGVEKGLDSPTSTMAILADQVRDIRDRAALEAGTANLPDLPRDTRSNILRGRIEDNVGLAYYSQSKLPEATTHFKRAVSVLPTTTAWGRDGFWHLGDALKSAGNEKDALDNYLKGYNPVAPDSVKLAVIQVIYKQINGTLDGLNDKLGAVSSSSAGGSQTESTAAETKTANSSEKVSAPGSTAVSAGVTSTATSEPAPTDASKNVAAPQPLPTPSVEPTPAATLAPSSASSTASDNSNSTPAAGPTPEPTPAATPASSSSSRTSTDNSNPAPAAGPTPEPTPRAKDAESGNQPGATNPGSDAGNGAKSAEPVVDSSTTSSAPASNSSESTTTSRKRTVGGSGSDSPAQKQDQQTTPAANGDGTSNSDNTEPVVRKRRVTSKKH